MAECLVLCRLPFSSTEMAVGQKHLTSTETVHETSSQPGPLFGFRPLPHPG